MTCASLRPLDSNFEISKFRPVLVLHAARFSFFRAVLCASNDRESFFLWQQVVGDETKTALVRNPNTHGMMYSHASGS